MRKLTKKYYFSVEGETEKWYLDWLQDLINNSDASCKVSFNSKVEKDPVKYVKGLSIQGKTIFHLNCLTSIILKMMNGIPAGWCSEATFLRVL